MATATLEQKQHAFDAAAEAGRPAFKVADLAEAELGRKRSGSPSRRCPA